MKKYHLVIVTWYDSRRPQPAWEFANEYEAQPVKPHYSVGWLIRSTKKKKVLAPNIAYSGDDMQICGMITIPTICITKIERLETGKKRK